MNTLDFSIVTPSFRSSKWLKLCIPSVADQEGVTLEHIVQDSVSDDGTLDWLPTDPRVQAFVEKDTGMYDAVNRGWKRCTGEILAYLNCDEQYLPGALKMVKSYFDSHPDVDIVFGGVVVTDPEGGYKLHRKMITPTLYHTTACHLATLSCAMFVRRKVVAENEMYFDPKLRDVGDGVWVLNALKRRLKMGAIPQFVSVFTDTGVNMSVGANAQRERFEKWAAVPLWIRMCKPLWILSHRVRKLCNGVYFQRPFAYQIYTQSSPEKRVAVIAGSPRTRWKL